MSTILLSFNIVIPAYADIPNLVAVSAITDGVGRFTELNGAYDVITTVIDGSTYALVTSNVDDGIQIIDISANTTGPALTITTTPTSPSIVQSTLVYIFTFSEDVPGFTA